MQERFHQFNRQDNSKKIEEGFAEMDIPVEGGSNYIDSVSSEATGVTKTPERISISDIEKKHLFAGLEKPKDILGLPTHLRKEGLAMLREKIASRYLSVSGMQIAIFDRIDTQFINGTLDEESLRKEIAIKSDEYNFSAEDQIIIDDLLYHFFRVLKKIEVVKNLPESVLLERLIKNQDLLPMIKGAYHVRITPYAIHFDFDDVEDFHLFVSDTESEAKVERKGIYGLSYYVRGYPVTASGYKPEEEINFRHEIQHKKFTTLTMDRILSDEKAERATRDEILARFSEQAHVPGIFDDVMSYGFADKYGVEKTSYEKILREAVDAVQKLQFIHFKKEEILGLLSKEKLSTWPKIVERMERTKVGRDLIQQRKIKRVKINKVKV